MQGFVAGIKTGPDDIRLLEIVRDRATPLIEGQPRIALTFWHFELLTLSRRPTALSRRQLSTTSSQFS